jgi:hypothetical protein
MSVAQLLCGSCGGFPLLAASTSRIHHLFFSNIVLAAKQIVVVDKPNLRWEPDCRSRVVSTTTTVMLEPVFNSDNVLPVLSTAVIHPFRFFIDCCWGCVGMEDDRRQSF